MISPRLFSILVGVLLPVTAFAQASVVRVRTEQVSKSDTNSYKTVQSRSLNVYVTNSSKEPLELKVKYVIFGRDLKSKEVVTIDQGDLPVSVKALGTEKVPTPVATAVSEEARIGSKGKSDDQGSRIIGQGVQVFNGETIVAETYDPPALKESFGKAPPAQKIEKKKK